MISTTTFDKPEWQPGKFRLTIDPIDGEFRLKTNFSAHALKDLELMTALGTIALEQCYQEGIKSVWRRDFELSVVRTQIAEGGKAFFRNNSQSKLLEVELGVLAEIL